jgi:hypothetical protein
VGGRIGKRSRTKDWKVRLPDGDHRVEVREDVARPIVAYCDGIGTALTWKATFATFTIAGHEARLVPGTNWRATGLAGAALVALSGVFGGAPAAFRLRTTLDLVVYGGDVEPLAREQT